MRDLVILAIHLVVTVAKLLLPGGVRSVVSESQLLKHQLLILNRSVCKAASPSRLHDTASSVSHHRNITTKLPRLVYSGPRLATFLYLLLAYSPFGALPAIST